LVDTFSTFDEKLLQVSTPIWVHMFLMGSPPSVITL